MWRSEMHECSWGVCVLSWLRHKGASHEMPLSAVPPMLPRAGTVKKGKAARQAIELLTRGPEVTTREREVGGGGGGGDGTGGGADMGCTPRRPSRLGAQGRVQGVRCGDGGDDDHWYLLRGSLSAISAAMGHSVRARKLSLRLALARALI